MSHGPALQACLDSINEREESTCNRDKKGEIKGRDKEGEGERGEEEREREVKV